MKMFWDELDALATSDLGSLGLTRRSDAAVYAGGVSKDTKKEYYNNTSITQPRFRRNKLFNSG